MRLLLQRVSQAQVDIAGQTVGQIGQGYLALVAVTEGDGQEDLDYLVRKMTNLRVFADEEGKLNKSILDVQGAVLSVSQFTLFADTHKGNRPNFMAAARPELAKPLYDQFNAAVKATGLHVEQGQFGADMHVSLTNDGPVTIMIDSKNK
ncbi:D-aminoacyl-tRNA deacylase [Eupransor demetentiae]|uniref:D-aminoacyl-tRNA deacylase n=1 Tax=Eupransor demetentiae TaxID=3109584 RepID=A0ABM9N4J5_9LACO|nr:D-aminoacyl-tRNA deacylase (Dtd) [Lactobacillaceae bacterium LMG 33000]